MVSDANSPWPDSVAGPGLPPPHRIAVVGPSCAGKSELAIRLGDRLGLPVVHMEVITRETARAGGTIAESIAAGEVAVSGQAWIAESAELRLLRRALERAELVVFLDIPGPRLSRNWLVRRLRYLGRSRPGTPTWFRQPINLKSFWKMLVVWDR